VKSWVCHSNINMADMIATHLLTMFVKNITNIDTNTF